MCIILAAKPAGAAQPDREGDEFVAAEEKVRMYEHKESGAALALAYRPDEKTVLPHHLAAVQGTLRVYGIADPLDFTAELQKAS